MLMDDYHTVLTALINCGCLVCLVMELLLHLFLIISMTVSIYLVSMSEFSPGEISLIDIVMVTCYKVIPYGTVRPSVPRLVCFGVLGIC